VDEEKVVEHWSVQIAKELLTGSPTIDVEQPTLDVGQPTLFE
jgi:hypothetical protein